MKVESIPSSDERKFIVFHKKLELVYPFFLCLQNFNKLVVQAMHHNVYKFVETFCCQSLGHDK